MGRVGRLGGVGGDGALVHLHNFCKFNLGTLWFLIDFPDASKCHSSL